MKGVHHFLVFALLALALTLASALDPSPLQDFCVAINNTENGVFVNGKFCKDPNLATPNDFSLSGFGDPRPTNNPLGSTLTFASVEELVGLNTQGIAMVHIDYAPFGGENPPHYHPRASEILFVLEGTLYVGFVTSNTNNTLFSKVLNKGDVFVFPLGLIHFQVNIGNTSAAAIAAFNSQNPSVITVANAIFNAKPPINPFALARAFQLDPVTVKALQSKNWYYNVYYV